MKQVLDMTAQHTHTHKGDYRSNDNQFEVWSSCMPWQNHTLWIWPFLFIFIWRNHRGMLLGNTFSKVSDYCLCHWCPSGQNKCIMCYLKWLTRCFIGPDRWSLSGTPNTNFYTHIFLIICLVCLVGKIYPFVAERTETWWLGTIIAQEGRDPPNSLHLLL